MDNWYKLDNAALIFPMISDKQESSSYRLAAVLHEEVDKEILRTALKKALIRFPMYCVKIKKGFFWHYLDVNKSETLIKEENPKICYAIDFKEQNDFLFKTSYYGKRISMEFFKSVLFEYFTLIGHKISNNGEILTENVEQLLDEDQDDFKYNYKKNIKKTETEKNAFLLKGKRYHNNWAGIISVIMNLESLKQVCKKYDATISEFMSAIILQSIHEKYLKNTDNKLPISLLIPVNVRKYFNSKTLRNFALFIRTNSKFENDITFIEILKHVKETFEVELGKEKIEARISQNINFEKNPLTRFVPLFIKGPIARIIYNKVSSKVTTLSFSNLGIVNTPKEMNNLIDRFEFMISCGKTIPINCSAVTYNNKMVFSFTSKIIERKFQEYIITRLIEENIKLVVETNDLEAK